MARTVVSRVEARWGMPFWDVVRDLHAQQLSMSDTARALGYMDVSGFCMILRRNPDRHNFAPTPKPSFEWIDRIEAEYGIPLADLIRGEAMASGETGMSQPMLAGDLGITRAQLRWAIINLGIDWPRNYHSERHRQARAKQIGQRNVAATKWYATVDGRKDSLLAHCKRSGINYRTVLARIKRHGMTPEQALTMPVTTGEVRARLGAAASLRARGAIK